MKPIPINIDAVPQDKRTHPDYLGLLNAMTQGMSDPAQVLSVCTHEAGHFYFGLVLKMEIIGMEGPEIVYLPPDRFQGYAARVKINVTNHTIEQVAVMLSAGGVFSREIDNALGSGDSDDFEMFKTTCKDVGVTDPNAALSLWKDGQKIVKDKLQDPIFKKNMREVAQHLMRDLENGV